MSPMAGISFPDKEFQSALEVPPKPHLFEQHHHVLERFRSRWSSYGWENMGLKHRGTAWEAKDAEWLLLNIITEIHCTPYSSAVPDIQKAYVPVVRTLVSEFSIMAWTSR